MPDKRVERVHAQPELGGDRGDRRAVGPGDRAREQARRPCPSAAPVAAARRSPRPDGHVRAGPRHVRPPGRDTVPSTGAACARSPRRRVVETHEKSFPVRKRRCSDWCSAGCGIVRKSAER
jgi:hypothetical protein